MDPLYIILGGIIIIALLFLPLSLIEDYRRRHQH